MEEGGSVAMPHETTEAGGAAALPKVLTERGGSIVAPSVIRETSPPVQEQGVGSKRARLDESGRGLGVCP
jgi:hypothetical protein